MQASEIRPHGGFGVRLNRAEALRKAAFSAILRCWTCIGLVLAKDEGPTCTQIKVLKGIPSVDDPFGARWSAQAAPLPRRCY
jgi:hypothetical protein